MSVKAHSKKFDKEVNQMIKAMENLNFGHYLIFKACEELEIEHKLLIPKEKSEDQSIQSLKELRAAHYEARRKTKVKLVAEHLVRNKASLVQRQSIILSSPKKSRMSKSPTKAPKSISVSKIQDSSTPMSAEELTLKKCQVQKQKILRSMQVQKNLKEIKLQEEARKQKIQETIESKQQKYEKEKKLQEEKLKLKFAKETQKREEILEKKYKDIFKRETKALKTPQELTRSRELIKRASTPSPSKSRHLDK